MGELLTCQAADAHVLRARPCPGSGCPTCERRHIGGYLTAGSRGPPLARVTCTGRTSMLCQPVHAAVRGVVVEVND